MAVKPPDKQPRRGHSAYRAVTPAELPELLADRLAATPGLVRVAVDGPPCAEPHTLADSLVAPLRARGRPVYVVRAETFWRGAALRLEYGHEDADSYLTWLDAGALRREVLDAAAQSGSYLPSLRDPATDRSTRATACTVEENAVLIVSGALLLGLGLPFELAVHLAVSPAARARRTPPDQAWTLPAFDRYDAEVSPADFADVVVRWNDPAHPAVSPVNG